MGICTTKLIDLLKLYLISNIVYADIKRSLQILSLNILNASSQKTFSIKILYWYSCKFKSTFRLHKINYKSLFYDNDRKKLVVTIYFLVNGTHCLLFLYSVSNVLLRETLNRSTALISL